MKKAALVLLVVIVLAVSLLGATQETKQPLKHELVKLNYVRPPDIVNLIRPYFSRDGRIEYSENQKFISVTDTAENVEKILATIKEIDVKPPDVLFTVQLILASEDGAEKTDEALANDPVIKELRSFLKYKSFSFLDASMVRAISDERSELTLGRKGEFVLHLRPRTIKKEKADIIQVEVSLNQLTEPYETNGARTSRSILESNLTLKSGEKTVVGVSRTAGGEKGLILIISAKLVD